MTTHAAAASDPPVPPPHDNEQEEEGGGWAMMVGGLTLDDEEDDKDGSSTTKLSAAERKRARQLRQKPGWYRKISRWTGKGTKKRIRELWPRYGVEPPPWQVAMDIPALFAPARQVSNVVVDVGFGDGTSLVRKAQELQASCPHVAFLGCEWHHGSVGGALTKLNETDVDNVRMLRGDFVHHLRAGWMGTAAIDEVCIFFPDPWPREHDHDRRVVNPITAKLLATCVKPGGFLHVATDVREYAAWVGNVMKEVEEDWEACAVPQQSVLYQSPAQADIVEGPHYTHTADETAAIHGLLPVRPRWRPVTRYESRGITELGHAIHDLCYRRRTDKGQDDN